MVTPAICVFTIARAARIFFFNKKNVNKKFCSARGGFENLTFLASAMGRCFCTARCFSKGSASSWQRHVLRSACLLPSTVVCMHCMHCTENYGMCKRWEFLFPFFFLHCHFQARNKSLETIRPRLAGPPFLNACAHSIWPWCWCTVVGTCGHTNAFHFIQGATGASWAPRHLRKIERILLRYEHRFGVRDYSPPEKKRALMY